LGSNSNEIILIKESKLFNNIEGEENFFFEHPNYLPVDKFTLTIAGQIPILSAAIEKENYFGVQFLPEKSGEAGSQLLKNFIGL
jgi:glutamine amidotransferase